MLGTIVGLVAIIGFVLPGFIASRIASRDRPAPATLTDLELILRALFYAIVVHLIVASTGWTAHVVQDLDRGRAWSQHVGEIAAFAAALVGAAVVLGQILYWAFDFLAPRTHWLPRLAFHALGGQDVRDGFEYIFLRRKKQGHAFIVVVHASGNERSAGVYGDASYFGFSPRAHDLYLEEMWDIEGDRFVRRREDERFGSWFRADVIENLEFRELAQEEVRTGSATRFGLRGIREVMRETRETIARSFVKAAAPLDRRPSTEEIQAEIGRLTELVLRLVSSPDYDDAKQIEVEIVRVGGVVVRALRDEEDFDDEEMVVRELRRAAKRLEANVPPWDLWGLSTGFYADKLVDTRDREGALASLGGLLVDAIIAIDEWDWQEVYEAKAKHGK